MKPHRIQLKRVKGFNLQRISRGLNGLDAIVVSRPSKFGNPFWHEQKFYGIEKALALYESLAHGIWNPALTDDVVNSSITYDAHHAWMKRIGGHPIEVIRRDLRGFNLACWCKLTNSCHADILLRIANE